MCSALLPVEYLGIHKDICRADCMFSRILIANATSKLYRTSSYLFLSPCTATEEAEREQEECQMLKELISEGIL